MPAKIYGNAFLRSGVAVLTYDKRGVGSSGGTFGRNRYPDFIDDGISAVRYLQSRSDVAAGSIGLFGSRVGGLLPKSPYEPGTLRTSSTVSPRRSRGSKPTCGRTGTSC